MGVPPALKRRAMRLARRLAAPELLRPLTDSLTQQTTKRSPFSAATFGMDWLRAVDWLIRNSVPSRTPRAVKR